MEKEGTVAEKKAKSFDFQSTLKNTFKTLTNVFKHPATKAIEDVKKFDDPKTVGIFAGFSIAIYLIISILASIIQTIFTRKIVYNYPFNDGGMKTRIGFENLKNFDFLKVLGDNFVAIVGVIFIISVVVYVLALVFKKQPNFSRLISIVTIGYAPLIAGGLLAIILNYFSVPLAIAVIIASLTLSISYMISANNKEIKLEGDKLIFFHVAAITIFALVAYFISTQILKGILSGIFSI